MRVRGMCSLSPARLLARVETSAGPGTHRWWETTWSRTDEFAVVGPLEQAYDRRPRGVTRHLQDGRTRKNAFCTTLKPRELVLTHTVRPAERRIRVPAARGKRRVSRFV